MKKWMIFLLTASTSVCYGAEFLNPMDFNGSETQKAQVIEYIKGTVKKDYCGKIDMCQDSILRMMEEENLEAFKEATRATDRKIMARVIHDYCKKIDMCNYSTIWMMYNENLEASQKKLSW